MYVIHRSGGSYSTLEPYESRMPKDVVQLHPGAFVAVLARSVHASWVDRAEWWCSVRDAMAALHSAHRQVEQGFLCSGACCSLGD